MIRNDLFHNLDISQKYAILDNELVAFELKHNTFYLKTFLGSEDLSQVKQRIRQQLIESKNEYIRNHKI